LRLRGFPAHIAEVLGKLESSIASSENSDVNADSPTANVTFSTKMYSLTTRLVEFVNDADLTKEENAVLRKNLLETKQKSEEKEDGYLREITKMKIVLDEAKTQIQNLRNDLELANKTTETLKNRTLEVEKEKLSLQAKSQSSEDQCRTLTNNLQKIRLEIKEIKESRDVMEVELASERNRNNILAGELQQALQEIERSKTHNEATGVALPKECVSCLKRFSREEKLKQKIQYLETELEVSKKDALESEEKLQALAEELRVRVLEEKARVQKLARKNSQLAAERANATQQLNAFEEVLNKAHPKTFHVEPQEESLLNDAMVHEGISCSSGEMLILRRLGVIRDTEIGDPSVNCPTM